MKFEIREMVHAPDPELVLRALEVCSREVSNDVVRFGDRITLRGLGPSPRTKNVQDLTVFSVNAEEDTTIISGEVKFQASALLGDQSQCDVMRSKLDDLFEQMKAKIRLDAARAAASETAAQVAVPASAVIAVEHLEDDHNQAEAAATVAPDGLIESLDAAPEMGWMAAAVDGVAEREEPAIARVEAAEPELVVPPEGQVVSELDQTESLEQGAEVQQAGLAEEVGKAEPGTVGDEMVEAGSAVETEPAVAPEPVVESAPTIAPSSVAEPKADVDSEPAQRDARTEQIGKAGDHAGSPGTWRRVAAWVIGVAALLAVAAVCYFFLFASRRSEITDRPAESAALPAGTVSPPPAVQGAPDSAQSGPLGLPVASTTSNGDVEARPADLKLWLQGWGVAMRTRDADAQAAYYADTMDLYEGHRNVSRDAVLKDREATIRMRKGLWTVKMENIVVVRQTPTEAEVRLTKHFMDQQAQAEILESFVPTRLVLKKTSVGWKISSEQDLTSLQGVGALSPVR